MVRRKNGKRDFNHLAPEYSTTFAPEKPWHSKKQHFYHLCTNCERGEKIAEEDFEWGTGDKELCRICENLILNRKCNVAYTTHELAR